MARGVRNAHAHVASLQSVLDPLSHLPACRYVIDFYNAAPRPDMPVAMHLDVRPALDSFGCARAPCSCLLSSKARAFAEKQALRRAHLNSQVDLLQAFSHPHPTPATRPPVCRAFWDRLRMQWGWVASGRWVRE